MSPEDTTFPTLDVREMPVANGLREFAIALRDEVLREGVSEETGENEEEKE